MTDKVDSPANSLFSGFPFRTTTVQMLPMLQVFLHDGLRKQSLGNPGRNLVTHRTNGASIFLDLALALIISIVPWSQ